MERGCAGPGHHPDRRDGHDLRGGGHLRDEALRELPPQDQDHLGAGVIPCKCYKYAWAVLSKKLGNFPGNHLGNLLGNHSLCTQGYFSTASSPLIDLLRQY